MDKLTMEDMNLLNTISGFLRAKGEYAKASILLEIQQKVTKMILKEEENESSKKM